jgi:hypothetical protein
LPLKFKNEKKNNSNAKLNALLDQTIPGKDELFAHLGDGLQNRPYHHHLELPVNVIKQQLFCIQLLCCCKYFGFCVSKLSLFVNESDLLFTIVKFSNSRFKPNF